MIVSSFGFNVLCLSLTFTRNPKPETRNIMGWLKNVVIDVAVTIIIILVTLNVLPEWADWIVYIYTPFMLLLKALALFSGVNKIKQKETGDEPPPWFFHALYAINLGALVYAQWWLIAGQWALIWLFSFVIEKRK